MGHLIGWLEGGVALSFSALMLVSALVLFKPEHVEHNPKRVYLGAALQGLIIGVLVGFVILPLRLALYLPEAATELGEAPAAAPGAGKLASLALLPGFLLLIIVRRGLLARAPLIGRYIRAYRRAGLKHQIDSAGKALARLTALDEKIASRA